MYFLNSIIREEKNLRNVSVETEVCREAKMLLSTGRENQTHALSFVLTLELLVVIV
jgi:hypothetical protein